MGSPAQGELLRGDVITKIEDYDARDILHIDAQHIFKTAGNSIKLVVHRDNKLTVARNVISAESSRCSSVVPHLSPNFHLLSLNSSSDVPHRYVHRLNHRHMIQFLVPFCHRAPSPLPIFGAYAAAIESPVTSLPRTEFPHLNESGAFISSQRTDSRCSSCFSPMPTRDHQQDGAEETSAIITQVSIANLESNGAEQDLSLLKCIQPFFNQKLFVSFACSDSFSLGKAYI